MRLRNADRPGSSSPLTSIGLQGEVLWWRYREGLFTRDGHARTDQIVAVDFDRQALAWTQVTFGAGRTPGKARVAESWVVEATTALDRARLRELYGQLQAAVEAGRPSWHPPGTATAGAAAWAEGFAEPEPESAEAPEPDVDPVEEAGDPALAEQVEQICGAIQVLSQGRSDEQRRRLKAVLRLMHHPDYDGERDFFLALELAFKRLEL